MDMNHLLFWLLIFEVVCGLAGLPPKKAEKLIQGGKAVAFATVRAFQGSPPDSFIFVSGWPQTQEIGLVG